MSTAIKIENVSKKYRLGTIGSGTLSHDLNRWWANMRGKQDPLMKIGESKIDSETTFWALKDLDFSIKQGEAVGIIGKNGAGKSTLLKILSRVTAPTIGEVKIKGRIASLLEVGTGFHPELTGVENIYLNGAILGMTRTEIKSKLDEIISFSGVELHINTPVKRYSSGMYVRLAFAVAAHLEAEILIVDEVLAVGDAEFQKKCIGKMNDVSSKDGRTVLFVSHSINSIRRLCSTGILLSSGKIDCIGKINDVISHYESKTSSGNAKFNHISGNQNVTLTKATITSHVDNQIKINDELKISIEYKVFNNSSFTHIEFFAIIYNSVGDPVIGSFQDDVNERIKKEYLTGSINLTVFANLASGDYLLSIGIFDQNRNFLDWVEEALCFTVENIYSDGRPFFQRLGLTVGKAVWEM